MNRKRSIDLRKFAESAPSENAPGSEGTEPLDARGALWHARIPLLRLAGLRFAAKGGRGAGGREPPYWAGTSRRKIPPRPHQAGAIQTAFLPCKEPRLDTNPSARATQDSFRLQIWLALARTVRALPTLSRADCRPWPQKPGTSLPRTPYPISENAENLRGRIPLLPCSGLIPDKFPPGRGSRAPERGHRRFSRTPIA